MIYNLSSARERLERRLLKRQTTVALSDLASRIYAGIEPVNLSGT